MLIICQFLHADTIFVRFCNYIFYARRPSNKNFRILFKNRIALIVKAKGDV
jgi:hypothetical protein